MIRRAVLLVFVLLVAFATGVSAQAPTRATGGTSVGLDLIAEGLTAPVYLAEAPDESGRLFIVDQAGLIRIITDDGTLLETPYLDVRDRMVTLSTAYDERGLLGLAFHPDYATNGRFFVNYSAPLSESAPTGWNHTALVSEFSVSQSNPNMAEADSERVILAVDKPQGNHNGGTVAFGPDGYLYFSIGDGGGANDDATGHVADWYDFNEGGNGQDVTDNLLGSILRIDVDGAEPYAIPPDNPFVASDGLDEHYAYGFRNPYRMSFDMGGTNELFVGDAGQDLWEEVDIVEPGGNYGWNVKEGTHCFDAANPSIVPADCPDTDPEGDPLIDPIIEYANANQTDGLGFVVVGGFVYRGSAIPELDGVYIFGDWSASSSQADGNLYAATRPSAGSMWSFSQLTIAEDQNGRLDHYLLGFGQDNAGEVYVLGQEGLAPTGNTGKVWQIVPAAPTAIQLDNLQALPRSYILLVTLCLLALALPTAAIYRHRRG